MSDRYDAEVHAYALMKNHYHLLIRTPHANASNAIQWLNVSYSVWFNKRRNSVGHVFQGRFSSTLIDGEGSWVLNAATYIHLNPIRTVAQGLGKQENKAEAAGMVRMDPKEVKNRLEKLRSYQWSSYGGYAGYQRKPEWMEMDELLDRAGGVEKYRRYMNMHVTRGIEPEGFEDFKSRLVLGAQIFCEKAGKLVKSVSKEQPQRKQLRKICSVAEVVKVVEKRRAEKWSEFSERHGDWGREATLYLARKRTGLTLKEIGEELGIGEYKTVGKAVQRFQASLAGDGDKRRFVQDCLDELSLVET